MSEYVKISENKFDGYKLYELNTKLSLQKSGGSELGGYTDISMYCDFIDFTKIVYNAENKLRDVINEEIGSNLKKKEIPEDGNFAFDEEYSNLRIIIKLIDKDWWFLHRGTLVFLVDGERISLGTPKSRKSGTTRIDSTNIKLETKEIVGIYENVVYFISKEDFKKICDAKEVHLKVSGEQWKHEASLNSLGQNLFKNFYREVFDNNAYASAANSLNYYANETKRANKIGIGVGCVIPTIITIILMILGNEFQENHLVLVALPFILLGGGWGYSYYLKWQAKKHM